MISVAIVISEACAIGFASTAAFGYWIDGDCREVRLSLGLAFSQAFICGVLMGVN